MQHSSLVSDRPPLLSLLFILILVFVGFAFIGPMVGLAVSSLFYDGNLLVDLQNASADPALFFPVMVMQGFTSLLGLILFPIAYLVFYEKKQLGSFFKSESDMIKTGFLIVAIGLCFLMALSPVVEWNMNIEFPESLKNFGEWARAQEDKLAEMTKMLTTFDSPEAYLLGMVVIALFPGIGEELVFRGLIQNELWRGSKNIHTAIWFSAILFSAIHMQFFGFVPRVLLGALFGYLYYWSGNLAVPMVAHFFHNGFTLTMIYLYNIGVINMNIDSQESAPWSLVSISVVATFTLLYFFYKHYQQEQTPA